MSLTDDVNNDYLEGYEDCIKLMTKTDKKKVAELKKRMRVFGDRSDEIISIIDEELKP